MSNSPVSPLRVAALPFAPSGATAHAARVSGLADRLADVARDGVSLAVFPEMSLALAWRIERLRRTELEALSEPLDGPSIGAVAQAVEATGVAAGVGWIERGNDGALYNSYVVCMPGGARHVQRKVYAMESPHLQSGTRFDVFDTPWGMKMSILIGADNYMPENARVAALKGATLLVAPHCTSLGAGASSRPNWSAHSLAARASDNGMFAVLSDAQAGPKDTRRPGAALIVDPCGVVIAEGVRPGLPVAKASIDPDLAQRSDARRWLAARKPELYASLVASEAQSYADARPWPQAERGTCARGAVAVSLAVVGRKR